MSAEMRESFDPRLARLYKEMRDVGGGVFWFYDGKMFGGLNRVDCLVVTASDYDIFIEVRNRGQVIASGAINEHTERERKLNFRTQYPALTLDLLLQMWNSRDR